MMLKYTIEKIEGSQQYEKFYPKNSLWKITVPVFWSRIATFFYLFKKTN